MVRFDIRQQLAGLGVAIVAITGAFFAAPEARAQAVISLALLATTGGGSAAGAGSVQALCQLNCANVGGQVANVGGGGGSSSIWYALPGAYAAGAGVALLENEGFLAGFRSDQVTAPRFALVVNQSAGLTFKKIETVGAPAADANLPNIYLRAQDGIADLLREPLHSQLSGFNLPRRDFFSDNIVDVSQSGWDTFTDANGEVWYMFYNENENKTDSSVIVLGPRQVTAAWNSETPTATNYREVTDTDAKVWQVSIFEVGHDTAVINRVRADIQEFTRGYKAQPAPAAAPAAPPPPAPKSELTPVGDGVISFECDGIARAFIKKDKHGKDLNIAVTRPTDGQYRLTIDGKRADETIKAYKLNEELNKRLGTTNVDYVGGDHGIDAKLKADKKALCPAAHLSSGEPRERGTSQPPAAAPAPAAPATAPAKPATTCQAVQQTLTEAHKIANVMADRVAANNVASINGVNAITNDAWVIRNPDGTYRNNTLVDDLRTYWDKDLAHAYVRTDAPAPALARHFANFNFQ